MPRSGGSVPASGTIPPRPAAGRFPPRWWDAARPGPRPAHWSDRRLAGASRRDGQGAGPVRLLLGPADRWGGVGRHAALAASVRPDRLASTCRRRGRSPASSAVLTAEDVPGKPTYGLITADQPVFASGYVRYVGEPVAAVAADHPETCRRALAAIVVDVRGARAADRPGAGDRRQPPADPPRRQRVPPPADPLRRPDRHRRRRRRGHVRDRDAGPGVPRARGGAGAPGRRRPRASSCTSPPSGCTRTASRSPPASASPRRRCGSCSAASAGRSAPARTSACRSTPACSRCASGARCASPTAGRRASSATSTATRRRSGCATTPPPTARSSSSRPASCSTAGPTRRRRRRCCSTPITHAQGPYRCPNAIVDGWAVRTNHLPCGAMRGFGVVQACFAHESQMDKLAAACGLDPVELRLRNAMRTGDRLITGQVIESVAPVARCIRETAALPLPDTPIGGRRRRSDAAPRRGRADGRCRPRPARRRLRRGDQEPDVLRGLRRLLDGPLPARRRRGHAEVRHRRGRPGLRHASPSRSPAPCSASTTSCSTRSTPRSVRPARRRRHARRG